MANIGIEKVDLTPEQQRQWDDTMRLMVWTCPGFRHLWYRLLQNHEGKHSALMAKFGNPFTGSDGVAMTDGHNIVCNPDTYFKYTLKERVFIAAHEITHCVYDDPGLLHRMKHEANVTCTDGKTFPYREAIMQKAMDYRINAMLVESRIGTMPKNALYDPKIAEGKDGIFDIYGKVYKNDDNGGGQGNQQQNGFDNLAPPGTTTGQQAAQAQQARNNQRWAIELAQAQRIEEQRTQGHVPASLKRMFQDILEPKIPWTDHIDVICKRLMGSGSYNWRKYDRRFIGRDLWLPGRGGEGAGWLVVWGDTSGSIGEAELNKYLGELSGIVQELRPQRTTVIWADADIAHIDDLKDVEDIRQVKARGVGGGGGTDITPVWDWIMEQRGEVPDMFIGMTDGYFDWPDKPAFPIIWASVHNDVKRYPYGNVVPIN